MDPNPNRRIYTKSMFGYKLALLSPSGTLLARCSSLEAALRTARAMFDITSIKKDGDGITYLFNDQKLCATVTPKSIAEHKDHK